MKTKRLTESAMLLALAIVLELISKAPAAVVIENGVYVPMG